MKLHLRITLPIVITMVIVSVSQAQNQIPVASPMTAKLAGHAAEVAIPSVFRVVIPSKDRSGTAFLHDSGKLITAAHVIKDANPQDIQLIGCQGTHYKITNIISDADLDIALLDTQEKINLPSLKIASDEILKIGTQVSTWGYPGGYRGFPPLLMSGYLSGLDVVETESGKKKLRWVVNAAFNNGNSGGPLVDIETGKVVGLVSSKLAPLPKNIESALNALKNQKSGFVFTRTNPDGKKEEISEAQVVEMVLQYLRSQTQLVIGYAVTIADLREFLKSNGIEP